MHEVKIEVGTDILEVNRREAEENRKHLEAHGIFAVDLLGAIGSGKTMLIEKVTPVLRERNLRVGAIAGDVYGDDDFQRLKRLGIPAVNVNTGKECHLDAHLVHHALHKLPLDEIDILFVENVGNLICPTDFPLGSHLRVVVVSVTEGDDVIRKHPMIFRDSRICVINKVDLAHSVGVDVEKMIEDLKKISPETVPVRTSLKTGDGVEEFVEILLKFRESLLSPQSEQR
ncbi:MAG: hydrogenase nickel incorporation protein HypB [Archaeoglobi archaeon]|nr:hydrogenase nickel incorporation protein HypB [Candidatus Mnemosynella bozhongmuii]MDI3502088.1 hydrogenase nickel incorporation protein HypB [Archaeoglobi archaeon]MDK2782329.1 hydrogenase nickel incorporation protein HypB [Archaeoglobi archaeon]